MYVSAPLVEILHIAGCPNSEGAYELVGRVAAELGIQTHIRLVDVASPEEAQRLGFLGSPTIRVNGSDVEPGAQSRLEFAYSCRVYRTATGLAGQPDERWVRDALVGSRAV